MTLLLSLASTVKRLSWSGPRSSTTKYSRISPPACCTTCCRMVLKSFAAPLISNLASSSIKSGCRNAATRSLFLPLSRNIAASSASNASASRDGRSRPPPSSSPCPRHRNSPSPIFFASTQSAFSQTISARIRVSSPSGQSEKAENRYSLATSESTESPRNSSRSLHSTIAPRPFASLE